MSRNNVEDFETVVCKMVDMLNKSNVKDTIFMRKSN